MGRTISNPVRYLKDERIRRVDTADEARDYQRLYSEILDVLTEHLRLPPSIVDNIRGYYLATHNNKVALFQRELLLGFIPERTSVNLEIYIKLI